MSKFLNHVVESFSDESNHHRKRQSFIFKKEVARAKEMYGFKLFIERFYPLRKVTPFAIIVLALWSIATGTTLLSHELSLLVPYLPIAVVLGFLLMILNETAKRFVGMLCLTDLLAGRFSFVTGATSVIAILTIGISIYVSVNGAELAHELLDDSFQKLEVKYQNDTSNIHQSF